MIQSLRSGERLFGIAATLLGVWFLWQATELRQGPGYAAVGPRVFPIIVGIGFVASGIGIVLRSGGSRLARGEDSTDWPTLAAMAALLAGFIALFSPLGFPISAAVFVALGAWILGSRSTVRDAVVGVLLGGVTYLVFTRLLGLELPAGLLEEPIRVVQDRLLSMLIG